MPQVVTSCNLAISLTLLSLSTSHSLWSYFTGLLALLQTYQVSSHLRFFFFFNLLLLKPERSSFRYSHVSCLILDSIQTSLTRRGLHWPCHLKCDFPSLSFFWLGFISFPSAYCWQMYYMHILKLFAYLHIASFHYNINAIRIGAAF